MEWIRTEIIKLDGGFYTVTSKILGIWVIRDNETAYLILDQLWAENQTWYK